MSVGGQTVRRRHHRRRTQRARLRRVSCPRRPVGLRSRAARGPRRRRGHRGIPSGISQFDGELHGKPAQPEGDPRSRSRAAWPADRRAAAVELPPAAGQSSFGRRRRYRRYAGRIREILAPRRRCAARLLRDARSRGRCAARLARRNAAQCGRRCSRAARRMEGRETLPRARPRGAPRRARPLHQKRGRRARSLVRVGTRQGGVRLRRRRRQLCEPLDAGLGVRAAASRVRRSERQAWDVGPRDRRNGRDHAGNGKGMQRREASRCARRRALRA